MQYLSIAGSSYLTWVSWQYLINAILNLDTHHNCHFLFSRWFTLFNSLFWDITEMTRLADRTIPPQHWNDTGTTPTRHREEFFPNKNAFLFVYCRQESKKNNNCPIWVESICFPQYSYTMLFFQEGECIHGVNLSILCLTPTPWNKPIFHISSVKCWNISWQNMDGRYSTIPKLSFISVQ